MIDRILEMFRQWLVLAVLPIAFCGVAQARVETFGDLEPDRPFTLLVIEPPSFAGDFGRPPASLSIDSWFAQPRTTQFRRWLSMANVKRLPASSPIVKEHHSDILREAKTFPAIALVDAKGGRWCLLSGESFPSSEYELARSLDTYHAAVMQAAREFEPNAIRSMTPERLNQVRDNKPRLPTSGPDLFDRGQLFNPTIRPQIHPPEGGVDLNTRASVDPVTLFVVVVCVGLFTFAGLIAVWIYCLAITKKPAKAK